MASNQPPPLSENPCEPPHHVSLASMLSQLKDLIYKISLPKTRGAKTVTLAIETLHNACKLIISACSTLEDPH